MEPQNEYTQTNDSLPLMIRVRAPATLPAGYTFEALLNDDPNRPFTCEVPEGGIEEGEYFLTPVPNTSNVKRLQAPTGRWKDGLCDCFNYGFFHPHIWCALFCSKLSMAQTMTRMQLTWLGEAGPRVSTQNTFIVVLTLLVSYITYATSLEIASLEYSTYDTPRGLSFMKAAGGFLFFVWGLYSLCRTRQHVREQYSIPEERCVGCEDVCCSMFCTCCTLAQMSRHTGEYETYNASCITKTGLQADAPLTV